MAKSDPKVDPQPEPLVAVHVQSSPPRGFYRAGFFIPQEGVDLEVTAAQLEELEAEPMIMVEITTPEVEPEAKAP